MNYGKYRAKVVKIDNGNKKIKVKCEDIYGDYESPWCTPCIPFNHAELKAYPKVGSKVWIEFEGGQISKPIWCGTWI